MTVPKTTVDKDDSFEPREDDVRPAWKRLVMNLEAESKRVQSPSDHQLRTRIAASYPAHIEPTLLRRKDVRHSPPPASSTIVLRHARRLSALIPGRIITAPNRNVLRYSG
jgi:hypothetical protein